MTEPEDMRRAQASARSVPSGAGDPPALPDQTREDTDRGWGEPEGYHSNDDRLIADRPPHWG